MKKYAFFISLLIAIHAQGQDILQKYESIFNNINYQGASISIDIEDVVREKYVFEKNKNLLVIPASTQKVLTTTAALNLLGPNFKFQTAVYTNGIIKDGVLYGDLVIKGLGDPTFCSMEWSVEFTAEKVFQKILNQLKINGINEIQGEVIADASFHNTAGHAPTWAWEDIGNYYGAGNWGINFNENQFKLLFRQNKIEGKRTKISHTEPPIPQFELKNEIVTGSAGSGDNAYVFSSEFSNIAYVRGTIPPGKGLFAIKGAIPNPPLALSASLYHYLQVKGIRISGSFKAMFSPYEAVLEPLISFESPELIKIINRANQKSINLYCESLLEYLCVRESSIENRDLFIKQYWIDQGIDFTSATLLDGSGLSTRNAVSAAQFVSFLRHVYSQDNFSLFKASLSEAGVTGTAKESFKHSSLKGKMWVKSGSMERVVCYVGYIEKRDGNLISFAVLINNSTKPNNAVRRDIRQFLEFVYAQ